MERRAKIVCTLGPATSSEAAITSLIEAGMNVARMNFSHGDYADHQQVHGYVRAAAARLGRTVGILADLQGPKIRLGRFSDGPHHWDTGDSVTITVEDVVGTRERVSTTYKGLANDARPGDRLLIDDGKVGLVVTAVEGDDVHCTVTEGGPVSNNKGISLPGMNVSVPAMSDKDIADLKFALSLGVDFVALSFVRSPSDVDLVHQVMDEVGAARVPVIAKLEKPEAVANLEAIVLAFDGVMVARGDLGVELPLEQVPLVQKRTVQIARENAKPVIVATQMLDSMIEHSRPTRAEASDVANAVLDGADAVMLSGETSVGKYPFVTVATMARIIEAVEQETTVVPPLSHVPRTKRGVLSYAARDIGERLEAKALVAFTQTGDTVRRLARLHTHLPLLAFTPLESTRNQLSLTWGTKTFEVASVDSTDAMVALVDSAMLEVPGYHAGDTVVIVAGSPPNTSGSTNLIRVHRLGADD
ncbi:pyruvate kinase [Nakamurella endophytica]|nr:pyruvate kinase [Nakamurella endophytica]